MDTIDFCLDMPLPSESQRQVLESGFKKISKAAGAVKFFTFTNPQTKLWTLTACFDDVKCAVQFTVQMEALLGKKLSSCGTKAPVN